VSSSLGEVCSGDIVPSPRWSVSPRRGLEQVVPVAGEEVLPLDEVVAPPVDVVEVERRRTVRLREVAEVTLKMALSCGAFFVCSVQRKCLFLEAKCPSRAKQRRIVDVVDCKCCFFVAAASARGC